MREGVAVVGPSVPTRSSTGPAGGATLLDLRPLERPDPVPDQRRPPPAAPDDAGVVVCVGLDPEQAVAVLRLLGRDTSVVLAPDAAHAVRLLGRGDAAPPAPVPPTGRQVLRVGDVDIDPDARQVTCRDRPVPVSAREFDLLVVLAGQPGRVHGFGELTERVWSRDYLGDDDSVASAVKRLRRRLAAATDEVRVESVRGIGYRLVVGDPT